MLVKVAPSSSIICIQGSKDGGGGVVWCGVVVVVVVCVRVGV